MFFWSELNTFGRDNGIALSYRDEGENEIENFELHFLKHFLLIVNMEIFLRFVIMRFILVSILFLSTLNVFAVKPDYSVPNFPYIIMLGPTVHWNLGENRDSKVDWGLEASCWFNDLHNVYKDIPMGFDFGVEINKVKFSTYSEFQIGQVLIGASIGPVYQYNYKENKSSFGAQSSVWANILLGGDLRLRYMKQDFYFTPGLYFKLPYKANFRYIGE